MMVFKHKILNGNGDFKNHVKSKTVDLTLASGGGGGLMQPPPMSFSEQHAKPFGVSC